MKNIKKTFKTLRGFKNFVGQHAKNIIKSNDGKLFYDEVVGIKLNTFYKDAITLIKLLTKCGYKVTAFYKESNK